ncbi:hypothetical protein [Cedecea sp. P7760]|uniref:hypothetical protein n=1 Tax=Cedecea sp. P7760 TaxID=2726983 RepID=UPI0015A1C090|nr:hypothetical protein [Cedecea sp. P7760]NWC62316.1 hypothetical protein [Cedecea sp. P7760]
MQATANLKYPYLSALFYPTFDDGLLRWCSSQSSGSGAAQPLYVVSPVHLPDSAFPGEEGIAVAQKGIHALEMRLLYALLLLSGSLLSLSQGGWNISDISVQFVLNLGN